MKTLREIEFVVDSDDDIYHRLEGDEEVIMDLTQEQAVEEEIAYRLGYSEWYGIFKAKIEKFGGRIVWEE